MKEILKQKFKSFIITSVQNMEILVRLTEDYLIIVHIEIKQNKLKMDIYEKRHLASQVYFLILGLYHLAYAREKYEKNITDLSI